MKRTLWTVGGAIVGSITFSVSFVLIMSLTPGGSLIERLMIGAFGTKLAEHIATITIIFGMMLGAIGGGVAGWQYASRSQTEGGSDRAARSEDLDACVAKGIEAAIARIVEGKVQLYNAWLHTLKNRDKVILSLLENYALGLAIASVWPSQTDRKWQERVLDLASKRSFAFLRDRRLWTDDVQSLETLMSECHSHWNAAYAKQKDTGPSGFYWVAEEVMLTVRPEDDPDIAVIDGLAEQFFQTVITWTKPLTKLRDQLGQVASAP